MEETNCEQKILKISEILELGEPKVSGNDLMMCCPFHKENNPSFGINIETGLYNCFACGAKGHISKIAKNLREHILGEKIDHIEKFKVSSKIDTVSFSKKPSGAEAGGIKNRLVNTSLNKYTIRELLEYLTTGHTISLSGAKKNIEWQGQQVVMIDLDNEYSSTFAEILDYAKSVGLEPTFAYQTYSSTENVCRCRLAYVLTEPITDKQRYASIYDMLVKNFQDYCIDKSCKDLCRLFYGTMNKDFYIGNLLYSTRFSVKQLNEVDKIIEKGNKHNRPTSKISENSDFFNGRIFLHYIFGQYMIDKYHIIRLNGNQLHFYKNGIYENNSITHDIEAEMSTIIPELTNKNIEEAMGFISRRSKRKFESGFEFIAFNNGVLNIITMNFIPFTPDIILTSRVNSDYVKYDENSSNSIVDQFFSTITCENKDVEHLLYEVIGYCCVRTNMYHLSFIFKGSGGNGKSTFFSLLKHLLGDSAASIRLKKLTTDKFATTSLYGKTCAIADDISSGKDVDTGLLKTLISGDGIRAEFKFENEFEFEPFATILIGMNNIVTFDDSSKGFARRFKVIPFNHTFEEQDKKVNMVKILCTPENLKYICSKAMYCFNEVIKRGSFTISEDVEIETKSYLKENSIVKQFIEELNIDGMEANEVQAEFKGFCKDNGYTPFSPKKLKEELKNLHYEKQRETKTNSNGKRPYIYVFTGKPTKEMQEARDFGKRLEQLTEVLNSDIADIDFSDCNFNINEETEE